jgi:hypothetical protein
VRDYSEARYACWIEQLCAGGWKLADSLLAVFVFKFALSYSRLLSELSLAETSGKSGDVGIHPPRVRVVRLELCEEVQTRLCAGAVGEEGVGDSYDIARSRARYI